MATLTMQDAASILLLLGGAATPGMAATAPLPVSTPPRYRVAPRRGHHSVFRVATKARPPVKSDRRRRVLTASKLTNAITSVSTIKIGGVDVPVVTFGNEIDVWVPVAAAMYGHPEVFVRGEHSILSVLRSVPQCRRNAHDRAYDVMQWLWLKLFEQTGGRWQQPPVPREFFEANAHGGMFVTQDRFKEALRELRQRA